LYSPQLFLVEPIFFVLTGIKYVSPTDQKTINLRTIPDLGLGFVCDKAASVLKLTKDSNDTKLFHIIPLRVSHCLFPLGSRRTNNLPATCNRAAYSGYYFAVISGIRRGHVDRFVKLRVEV